MKTRNAIIAAAGMAAASIANAQTNITLYGLLDAGVATLGRTVAVDDRFQKLNSDSGSSSRWGIRGSEGLGGGLSAIFNAEAPIDMRNGIAGGGASSGAFNAANTPAATAASFWRRNAWVGLSSSYGQLRMGRINTATVGQMGGIISATPSGINTGFGLTMQSQGISNDFWNSNTVRYDSPKLGPIDFAVTYSFGETGQGNKPGSQYGANIRYMAGPLAVGISHQVDNDIADTGRAVDWTMIAASYRLGSFTLHAGANQVDNSDGVGGFVDSDMWTLGVNYKATQSLTFGVQYWTVKESVGASSRSKLLVLNADYALSKRTFLYALFGYTDTEELGISPLWGNGNFAGATNTIVSNDKNNGLALGIRHVF